MATSEGIVTPHKMAYILFMALEKHAVSLYKGFFFFA